MKNIQTGQGEARPANPIYMFFWVAYEAGKELFTSTYSLNSTFKIIGILVAIYLILFVSAVAVETVWNALIK